MAAHRIAFVRHGQSVHNAAYLLGREPPDGLIDAPLSDAGREQCGRLRETLGLAEAGLVVTSPLSRAIETALILFPRPATRIVATDLLRELVAHPCDIPRAPALLAADFPRVDFSGVAERGQNAFETGAADFRAEPAGNIDRRCAAFLSWLLALPDPVAAVVGHGTYLKRLLGVELDNCGVMSVSLRELREIQARG